MGNRRKKVQKIRGSERVYAKQKWKNDEETKFIQEIMLEMKGFISWLNRHTK